MYIKGIIDEDFINYKKPSMIIEFPYCSFKCDKECGMQVCQNSALALSPNIKIRADKLVERYIKNDITKAIVMQGLEPFDSWDDLWKLICEFRHYTLDDIVIYSGYTQDEIYSKKYITDNLRQFPNIVIKYGRYIPNRNYHYDEILGIKLASDNQYAEKIS